MVNPPYRNTAAVHCIFIFRLLGAAEDSLGLDGENSLDCGVVPSIDTQAHAQMDTGGFNLLQVRGFCVVGLEHPGRAREM